jgi:hypothetical protein
MTADECVRDDPTLGVLEIIKRFVDLQYKRRLLPIPHLDLLSSRAWNFQATSTRPEVVSSRFLNFSSEGLTDTPPSAPQSQASMIRLEGLAAPVSAPCAFNQLAEAVQTPLRSPQKSSGSAPFAVGT